MTPQERHEIANALAKDAGVVQWYRLDEWNWKRAMAWGDWRDYYRDMVRRGTWTQYYEGGPGIKAADPRLSDTLLAVWAHECGHVASKHPPRSKRVKHVTELEVEASKWAAGTMRKLGHEPTPEMLDAWTSGLSSYVKRAGLAAHPKAVALVNGDEAW